MSRAERRSNFTLKYDSPDNKYKGTLIGGKLSKQASWGYVSINGNIDLDQYIPGIKRIYMKATRLFYPYNIGIIGYCAVKGTLTNAKLTFHDGVESYTKKIFSESETTVELGYDSEKHEIVKIEFDIS